MANKKKQCSLFFAVKLPLASGMSGRRSADGVGRVREYVMLMMAEAGDTDSDVPEASKDRVRAQRAMVRKV